MLFRWFGFFVVSIIVFVLFFDGIVCDLMIVGELNRYSVMWFVDIV